MKEEKDFRGGFKGMNIKIKVASKIKEPQKILDLSGYQLVISYFLIGLVMFYGVRFLEESIYQIFTKEHYLILHTLMEFITIIVYTASFLIIYYVGEWDKRLRMKVLAAVFLFVAGIDFWHTFSYSGMPGIFVPSSNQSAICFWVVGRIGFAAGLLISSFIPLEIKVRKIHKWLIVIPPMLLSFIFLFLVSYFPGIFPDFFIEGKGLTIEKYVLEYIIIIMLIIAFINFMREYKKTRSNELPLLLSALILSIFSELSFTNYFSVYDTYNLLGHIYKLIASFLIFKVLFIVNIHHPYYKLNKAEKEIIKYANNLEQLVQQRTEEINQANQEMLRDLEYAKTIQKAIMPVKHAQFDNLEVYSEYVPYEKVGGDFYGFEDLNDSYLAFYIGDVAGHGIPAAMMTIFMKQTIITEKIFQSGFKEIFTPKEVLANLYKEYNATDFPLEMYAVMIYGVYNKKTKDLIFSSAGLNTYPLIYKDGIVEPIEHTGFPICKFDKNYQPEFQNYIIPLKKGNRLLFYTDGIIEVSNRKGELFGEERLIKIFQKKGHLSLEKFSQEILKELNQFTKGVRLNDDVHYFIMEVK